MKPRLEIDFSRDLRRAFLKRKPEYTREDHVFPLNHARSGLLLALKSLGLPKGSKVGVMVYNCHTVMNAVAQAGCVPVFIDIDDHLSIDLADLQRKSASLSALVVTHLFGVVNDVATLRGQFPNLPFIEDCAHVFGKEIMGDFGVYSVGQGKLPSLGDGGLLTVSNQRYLTEVERWYEKLPCYTQAGELKLFARLLFVSLLHKKWIYGWLTRPLKQRRKPQHAFETVSPRKMSLGVSAMLALRKDTVEEQVSVRLRHAEKLTNELSDNPLVKDVIVGSNAFMLVARCTDPEALRRQFEQMGIETATHFVNSIQWAREFGYVGDCPNAERLVNELLMIPVY